MLSSNLPSKNHKLLSSKTVTQSVVVLAVLNINNHNSKEKLSNIQFQNLLHKVIVIQFAQAQDVNGKTKRKRIKRLLHIQVMDQILKKLLGPKLVLKQLKIQLATLGQSKEMKMETSKIFQLQLQYKV